jgi:hypothetical protein
MSNRRLSEFPHTPGSWIKCRNPLFKPEHFFFRIPKCEWFERKGICCLCHGEQLRADNYQAPNFGYLKETFVSNRIESKPEKDSL